jgi:hypothetical protein
MTVIEMQVYFMYWPLIFLPGLVPLTLFPIAVHLSVNVYIPKLAGNSKARLLFVFYQGAVAIAVFGMLLGFKLEEADISWAFVFVPIWYGLFIYLVFLCFLIPGMLDSSVNR